MARSVPPFPLLVSRLQTGCDRTDAIPPFSSPLFSSTELSIWIEEVFSAKVAARKQPCDSAVTAFQAIITFDAKEAASKALKLNGLTPPLLSTSLSSPPSDTQHPPSHLQHHSSRTSSFSPPQTAQHLQPCSSPPLQLSARPCTPAFDLILPLVQARKWRDARLRQARSSPSTRA
eukprot:2481709-Rhodomonas_salina.1